MKTWEVKRDGAIEYVQILPDQIVYGQDTGNRHQDSAGGCSLTEFLGGRFQESIRRTFGDRKLAEMIALAGKLSKRSSTASESYDGSE